MNDLPESTALCRFSKSEVYADRILVDCPLALRASNGCPCRKRLYDIGTLQLRVLSCTYPNTWDGRPIHDEDAIRESLQPTKSRKPRERKVSPMNDATTDTADAGEAAPFDVPATALATTPAPATNGNGKGRKPAAPAGQALLTQPASMYDKIGNPAEVIPLMGRAIFDSKMFGCHTLGQGIVLAWACFAERRTPIEIKRRYHLIGGELSMKADAMLAEFRSMHGGTHEIIERTPDRVALRLTRKDGKAYEFAFTFEEALCEDYIYTKEANAGKTPKTLRGEPNVAAFKDNWSTPRRRMQMMWARVVSDSVRAVCPEVNAGAYTPEELGAGIEYEATAETTTAAAAEPGEIQASANDAHEAAEETAVAEQGEQITAEQLAEMAGLKKSLDMGKDVWLALMGKFGKTTAKDLRQADADRVLAWLRKQAKAKELNDWANGATKPQAAAEGDAGNG